nr:ATP-dependent Clp protease ATP-binding subunit ClpA homolog CD4B, chloroplastic-like [Tanacetum cinerariifolium]
MMCNTYPSPMRMRMFSGLRGSNALDNIMRTGVDFHFKIIASSVRKKRVSQVVPKAMFERFTKKTIKIIMLAQAEAHRLGHNFVGTKHILLGLIAKPGPTEESRKPNVIGWSEAYCKKKTSNGWSDNNTPCENMKIYLCLLPRTLLLITCE